MVRAVLAICLCVSLHPIVHGRNFYIDNGATGASDGTSWTNAWPSFDAINWPAINPGDNLILSGGSDSNIYTGDLVVPKSGLPGLPITIQVEPTDPAHSGIAIINGGYIGLLHQSYITVTGNVNGERHLRLQNYFDTSERTFGNAVFADSTVGVTLEYVEADNVNQMISLVGSTQFTVRRCSATNVRGDAAVRAVNCYGDGFNVNIVEDNSIVLARYLQTGYGPDGVQGSDSLTIRNNYITITNVNYFTSGQHPDYCQVTGNNLIISGNEFVNLGDSCIDMDWWANPAPHDIWIENNVFRITQDFSPYPVYIRFYASAGYVNSITNLRIYNNNFLDNPWLVIAGPSVNAANATCSGFEVKNNIFVSTGALLYMPATPNFTDTSCSFADNIYVDGSIQYRGTNYDINSGWLAIEPTRIVAPPQFVCYSPRSSANDLHLAFTDTAAKGQGEDLSAYFGIDKDGNARPVDAPWDIGAYQALPAPPGGDPPLITQQPQSLEQYLGTLARFQVTATGDNLTYHWRFNDTEIPGANTNELRLPRISAANFGQYSVQVVNSNGCVLSDEAELSLFVDTDGDGLTDQWERGVGRYKLVQGNFTWSEAKADAEARGGHLATVRSNAEWKSIQQILPNVLNAPRWIGLRRETDSSDWQWVTAEPFQYALWAEGYPNLGDKSAAVVELTSTGAWKDRPEAEGAQHSYLFEIGYYTDPLNWDTDGDGFSDGEETNFYHTLPTDPLSKPTLLMDRPGFTASGAFLFYLNGIAGQSYHVQTSTNLVDWAPLLDITLPDSTVPLGDYEPPTDQAPRYYRAIPASTPAATP